MLSLIEMREMRDDVLREYLMLEGLEPLATGPAKDRISRRLLFLARKHDALTRNINAKARREALLRQRVMLDPYLGRYVRSFGEK